LTLGELLQDVYIGVFAVLLLGSMLVSVLMNLSALGDGVCVTETCVRARSLLPWLIAGTVWAVLWSLARLLGPVAVSPGVASWLLPTPVDRGSLLARRACGTTLLAAGLMVPATVVAVIVAGFDVTSAVLFTVGAAGVASCGVAVLVHVQTVGVWGTRHRRHPALLLGPASLVGVGVGLAVIAMGRAPLAPTSSNMWWAIAAALTWLGVLGSLLRARGVTGRLRRRDVAAGGVLVPGLGGALASLDLALMFDVVLGHVTGRRGRVRSRRGGPSGLGALVWRDVIRLRRSPARVLLLAGGLLLPYAGAEVGGGEVVLLVEVLVCFFLVLPMLVALRVLTRSGGMVRALPLPIPAVRAATLVVPGVLLAAYGLISAPALHRALDVPAIDAALLGVACGLGGLAAGARWVTGRPPDYGRPLISTPAGAVPANLYGSVLRGFDVAALVALPMLFAPTGGGAVLAMGLSLGVLTYLCGRR